MNGSKNASSEYVIGIDLGGTHFQIGVINHAREIVGRSRGLTLAKDGDGGDGVTRKLCSGIHEAVEAAGISLDAVSGIGVGTPSPIDSTFRIAMHAVNLEWLNYPLADRLTEMMGGSIGVTLDNDVNCAIWGEYKLGAGQRSKSLLGLWIGTGIGGGLVFDGNLYHGAFGTAGEIGRTIAFPDRNADSWVYEDHASRLSSVQAIEHAIVQGDSTSLASQYEQDGIRGLHSSNLAHAVNAGDEVACRVLRQSAQLTGVMAANAATLLSLDRIVVGGGIAEEMGEVFIPWMREQFDKAVFPAELKKVSIQVTQLRENAGVFGAALLARERLIEKRS